MPGDFNAILNDDEKWGGSFNSSGSCRMFQDFCSKCGLKDLDFYGPKYTWNRGNLFEHLDRALCNVDWDTMAPSTSVHNLYKLKFDHLSLAICFGMGFSLKPARPFRFLSAWLMHKEFGKLVEDNWNAHGCLKETVQNFTAAAKRWSSEVFGNILKKKRILIARISGIQRCLENYRSQKLVDLERELRAE